jgi:Tol biopolymer transport system component
MIPSVAEPGRLGTAVIDPDGDGEVIVPFPDATLFLGPGGWTPDGRLVLEGFDPNDPARPEVGLYIANPDGSGLRQVTSSSDGRMHVFPTVSPDGRHIVFVAQDPVAPAVGAFAGDLFIVGTDGSGLRQVNPAGTKVVVSGVTGRPADWSPDGRQLAYAATLGALEAGRSSAVFMVPAEGGEPVRISELGTSILSVDWSPDGAWLAYWEGNVPDLVAPTWIASPDGRTVRQLMGTGTSVQGCCVAWSPDSTLILFQRFGVGGLDLWTMDLNGNPVARITSDPAAYIWYSWAKQP